MRRLYRRFEVCLDNQCEDMEGSDVCDVTWMYFKTCSELSMRLGELILVTFITVLTKDRTPDRRRSVDSCVRRG